MAKNFITIIILLNAVVPIHTALAETKVTGFASMVGGIVTRGQQFLTDYPNTGLYDDDMSFSPDTSFGVQLKTTLKDDKEFIIQLLSHGSDEFNTAIDWAYINYPLNSAFSIQIGRKRLPLYYYSDFYELGFAYYWIHPPSDNYTWQITNYNGMSLFYEPTFENWDALFNIYLGREDDNENKLLTFLANNTPVSESWKNMLGFVSEISNGTYDYRFTVMSSQLTRQSNNTIISDGVNQIFYGISLNAHFENTVLLSEFNRYERPSDDLLVKTYMLSFAYKIDKMTPHITYSELRQSQKASGGDEYHYTYSLGLRRDLSPSTAFKIQYDITTDKAAQTKIVGDGELLSFGLDIIF